MKDEYGIVNITAIQKRIEELENKIIPNPDFDSEIDSHNLLFIAKQNELNKILSQSTPLISEIEKAFNAGEKRGYEIPSFQMRGIPINTENPTVKDYISNLKLDI